MFFEVWIVGEKYTGNWRFCGSWGAVWGV